MTKDLPPGLPFSRTVISFRDERATFDLYLTLTSMVSILAVERLFGYQNKRAAGAECEIESK